MDGQRPRIAIVGAGILGLVAGRELAEAGCDVVLYERWPDVGGQAGAFDLGGGVWLERYYHHLFESDRDMISLYDELLPGDLEWYRSSVGMFAQGRTWPFSTALDLLRYSPLPLADRVRLGAALWLLIRRGDPERMDAVSAVDWLTRFAGRRATDGVVGPLLLGKFGDDAAGIPLSWLWSKLVLRRGRRSGHEMLGYPRGSFRGICVALADRIRERGGRIELDCEIVGIDRVEGRAYLLRSAAPGAYRRPLGTSAADAGRDGVADVVILTTPADIAGRLIGSSAYADGVAERYRAAVVLLLELRRPFTRTYWINIADRDIPFLGLIEHTNLLPAERYSSRYLYVTNYVARDDAVLRSTTDELVDQYMPALRRISPGFGPDDILRRWSFREEAAQPIPRVRGSRQIIADSEPPHHRLPINPFETSVPGVFVANTTHVHPEDRGTNYSARLGVRIASHVLGKLRNDGVTNKLG